MAQPDHRRHTPQVSSHLEELASGEVHVHVARLNGAPSSSLRELCLSVLSPVERERCRSFAHDRDRWPFLVGRGLLRHALSCYADVAPARWTFTVGEKGKPGLGGPTGAPRLRFNLTNTEGLAACAIALGRSVGIDAEAAGRIADLPAIAAVALSEREAADLAARPPREREERLLQYWTSKEAYLKATGVGLGVVPPRAVSLELGAGGGVRLQLGPEVSDRAGRWHLVRVAAPPPHVVALAVERSGAQPPEVRVLDGLALLEASARGASGW